MKFIVGRHNLACTIFVPFNCSNNCPFCTSKYFYSGFIFQQNYLDKIINNIKIINKIDFVKEFVLTGGEPFSNLEITRKIINAMEKPVYINTSLPSQYNNDIIIEFINNETKIKGINISRHISYNHCNKELDLTQINKIKKLIRINSIVSENNLNDKLISFINYYVSPTRMINLRRDYRTISTDTLKNRDKISEFLLDHYKYEYSSQCLVCNSEIYSDENYKIISYHRGLEHSSVLTKYGCYVNDIIIDMYGDIYKDWNREKDIEFNKWINENDNMV